jgi:mono/diheme cytochrome c family protein
MRHVYVNRAAIVLAVLLVVSTALFAWWRSQDLALVVLIDAGRLEATDDAAAADAAAADDADAPTDARDAEVVGASLYVGECRSCHLRLTHVPGLVAADGGRAYLVDFLLFGFDGEAEIDGSLERFDHPPFAELSDEEVAAVLNHLLVSWGNEDELPDDVEPYRPGEVGEARDRDLTPAEVAERRPNE